MHRSINIVLDKNKQIPTAFMWSDKRYMIAAVQECWRLNGAWWDGEGEQTFFRVLTDGGGIFELCYDHAKQTWILKRVED